jgi:hypothetical protein
VSRLDVCLSSIEQLKFETSRAEESGNNKVDFAIRETIRNSNVSIMLPIGQFANSESGFLTAFPDNGAIP